MDLTPENTSAWLSAQGLSARPGPALELGGGVSNRVFAVPADPCPVVVKQSLGRLRVEQEWLSDRRRIFREAAAMRLLSGRVRGGRVPRLLLESPGDFAIAIESAPPAARMWKTCLFAGELDPAAACAAGTMLGSIIAASWLDPAAENEFGDQTVFDQLRLDPYYRAAALRHPARAAWFQGLLERTAARRVSLVHGDWSPKNLLVAGPELWAIDWEVIHYGDPSFDVGFLLNHLLLKSIALPALKSGFAELADVFTTALRAELPADAAWVPDAGLEHLPALLLARVDGKSPAEYLDPDMRVRARGLALGMMDNPPATVAEAFSR